MKKNAQVLIVDDQEGVRNLLLETCLILGYEAQATDSGQEALDLVKKNNYKIALIDMKMPGLDGFKTTQRIMKMTEQIRIVMITGVDDNEDHLKEIRATHQVVAVMKKPFALEKLKEILAENITV